MSDDIKKLSMRWWSWWRRRWSGFRLASRLPIWISTFVGRTVMSSRNCFIKWTRGKKSIIFLGRRYCLGKIISAKVWWRFESVFLNNFVSFPILGCCPQTFHSWRSTMTVVHLERLRHLSWSLRLIVRVGEYFWPETSTVLYFWCRVEGGEICGSKISSQAFSDWRA